MESVGLKEWALVCEALGRGEQCVLVRKGGIAEGRAGFAFRHPEFFLLPTFFHEQIQKVRGPEPEIPERREGEIEVRYSAKVDRVEEITSWEQALELEPLHILASSIVRERFEYDGKPGLHVAFVRAFRLEPAWIFPDAPKYGGCRSWVSLPECPGATRFEPVLSETEHLARQEAFRRITAANK